MWRQVPRCSFRQDADMAGAIFMSNSETRKHCFRASVFGLPPEYAPFVNNVKQGMPLFLFDYTERKLYGVFEATSDGGMDINRAAFRSTGRCYPAQVCFKIIWKCKPLTEDEFFLALEENYYVSKKFFFDLSYQQVVQLYGLFNKKRVEHPICNYSVSANLEQEHSSKGRPHKRSLTPDISPFSAGQAHNLIPLSIPKISTVETNYSASSSMHPTVPPIFETQPNVSMPLVTKPFGVQIAPIHTSHHDRDVSIVNGISAQVSAPCSQTTRYHRDYDSSEHIRDVSTVNGISTQVSAPCSQTTRYHRDQIVADQSYPLSPNYPHNSLSSGCMAESPTDGVRLPAKQSYVCSSLLSPRYTTQVSTGGDRNYLCSTPYVRSYPHFSLANPQCNANWKDDYDINCTQCKEIYASEHQHLSKGKALMPPKLTQHGIPAYPEVSEISAIDRQKESFTDYISIPDCDKDFETDQWKHGLNCNASGSSGLGNGTRTNMSGQLHTDHSVGAECNTTVPGQRPQNSVFSRLSLNQQTPCHESTGPSLNQLLCSLSQRTKQWSSEKRTRTDDVGKQSVQWITENREHSDDVGKQLFGEQVMDRPCPLAELNLPSLPGGGESLEPPFLNFKRRSEASKLDANLGKEITGKVKRRKLVRPSFGEDNSASSSGKELQENGIKERKHNHVEAGGNKLNIDLNEPVSVDSNLVDEDGSIVLRPTTVIRVQTDKLCEVNTNKPNCSTSMEVFSKQDLSLDNNAPTDKISLDLNVADLNTMDKSKLQAILGSSLLQALDKLRNGKSNSEEARSSICGNDSKVKMESNSDGSTKPRCN